MATAWQHFINGQWQDASTGKVLETVDPSDESVLATIARGTAQDIERAVQAAGAAMLGDWGRSTPKQHARVLVQVARLLDESADGFAELETREGREHEIGALFAFLAHTDLPATNHRAEQAIRPAVVNRKVSGGNRTWNGAFAQERIMSVLFTARRQGLDLLDLFTQALQATEPIVLPIRGLENAASS